MENLNQKIKKQRKLMLIVPPSFDLDLVEEKNNRIDWLLQSLSIPHGPISIAAYVQKNSRYDVDVRIIDLNLEVVKYQESASNGRKRLFGREGILFSDIEQFQPDIIGLSAIFSINYKYISLFLDSLPISAGETPIIMGGGAAWNLQASILKEYPRIHAICIGEGEIPVLDLVDSDDYYHELETNVSFITVLGIQHNKLPKARFVQNLDDIPFGDDRFVDVDEYFHFANKRLLDKTMQKEQVRSMSIFTSRGCPFHCIFCTNGSVHGKTVRYMTADRVMEDIMQMVKTHHINLLCIEDDLFLHDQSRAKDILNRIAQLNLSIRIEFPNGVPVYGINDEIAGAMRQAGVSAVSLGVESGSDHVLQHIIRKPLKADMVVGAVKSLRRFAIGVQFFIVTGFPSETKVHRQETINLILEAGIDWAHIFIATPLIGSELYKLCEEKGYLVSASSDIFLLTTATIHTPDFTPEEIEDAAYKMNLEVNFIKNYNYSVGNYEVALAYFQNVYEKYPDHAIVCYCMYLCYMQLKNDAESRIFLRRFQDIVHESEYWRKYADYFHLQSEDGGC